MTVRVIRDRTAPMRHTIEIGSHRLAADVSVAEGGGDSAPSPHDLYDAALGACKGLTVLWFARRKGIPVEDIEVLVTRDDSQERAGAYRLDTVLTLTGNLSSQQRQELLRAAQKCPIHRLMTEVTTEITTALAGEE
jgi:putative redox protein